MRLDQRKTMYRQGALDSLCGVYAIINSSKAVCDTRDIRLDRDQCKALFVELCGVLADGGQLADGLTEGTTIRTFRRMTRTAHAWLRDRHELRLDSAQAFGTSPGGLDHYWSRVLSHVEEYGPGSVLIRLSGRYEHWSCIRSMSDRGINLMDSDGIKRLSRERCTVGLRSGRRRRHVLLPTQTVLVSVAG